MPTGAPSSDDCRHVLACPGCGGVNARALGPTGREFAVPLRTRSYVQPAYQVMECAACGLLYKNHVLSDEELTQYYSEVDYHKWEIPGLFPTERQVHRELAALPRGARILDIGCSSGRLLASLPVGFLLFGVEPNADASAEAAAKGITMLRGLDDFDGEPFDAMVLMDVFEHLTVPADALEGMLKHLKPGGRLIMATGDGDHSLCREAPADFWYFRNVEHVCMLTRSFARHLEGRLGIRLMSWRVCSHYDSPLSARFVKRMRLFAFRQSRAQTWLWRLVLRFLPMVGRAADWKECPAYDLGEDHVVVVFQKNKPD